MFPNEVDRDNHIAAGKQVVLPRTNWSITADGPPGTDHILTMLSRAPRDFLSAGLKPGNPMATFDLDTMRRLWTTAPSSISPYAGTVQCKSGSACPGEYGATLMRVLEVAATR
jgi:Domain of unknown function (DUF4384)